MGSTPMRVIEHDAGDMRRGAGAGRAELHLGLVRLGVGDEILKLFAGRSLRAISVTGVSAISATGAKSVEAS